MNSNAVVNRAVADEPQALGVAGLAEQALAGPERDRKDLQPQFVDEVVLDQRVHDAKTAEHEDLAV